MVGMPPFECGVILPSWIHSPAVATPMTGIIPIETAFIPLLSIVELCNIATVPLVVVSMQCGAFLLAEFP